MNIDSGRVILRAIEEADLAFLQDMMNDPAIEKMIAGYAFPVSYDRQVRWFSSYDQQKELRCMIQLKDGPAIGMIMLTNIDHKNQTAELAQKTKAKPEDRRPGDMVDAMMGILNYAFNELNLNCVYGTVLEYNLMSRKLAAKCGLKEEGILRQRIFKGGKHHNVIANSVIREDFVPLYKEYKEKQRHDKP
ncbi:MAG: GNAT family N-acetyltransferase [Christensenellales bacterium]|jgi:RimJ/RimL family protein N-acetyltransferase